MPFHKNLVGAEAIHDIMYVTNSDPGAVGAYKFWLDTTVGASLETGAILKQRNAGDSAWTTRATLGTASALTSDTDGTLAANSDTKLATQKATKTYVDAKVAGLSWKQAVRVATTANGTLASAFANGSTVDGVTLATGDRLLIKNQSSAADNGIYVVASSGAPARASDADSGAELVNATCYVSEGTANADTQWTCTNNATPTLGSTSLAFAQLTSGSGGIAVSTIDAKGDLLVGTANDTIARQAVGNNGTQLTADSAQTNGVTYQRGVANTTTALVDGSTITWDFADRYEMIATVTLGGNRTLAMSNTVTGCRGTVIVKQDGTGSRTLALPSGSKVVNTGAGSVTLTTTASAIDVLSFIYDGTNYWWTIGKTFT